MKDLLLTAVLLATASSSDAATLALYGNTVSGSTSDVSNTPASQANGASAVTDLSTTSITGAGLVANGNTFFVRNSFGTGQWITGSAPGVAGSASADLWIGTNTNSWTVPASPMSTTHYYQFTLTATNGKMLDLNTLTFDWQAAINNSTSTGTFTYQLFASVNGGAYGSLGSVGSKFVNNALGTGTDWGTLTSESINLDALDGATSVAFRLALGSDIAGGVAAQFFRNVSVDGVVTTAVPEPSTYGLLGAGALAAFAFVRRRKKSL